MTTKQEITQNYERLAKLEKELWVHTTHLENGQVDRMDVIHPGLKDQILKDVEALKHEIEKIRTQAINERAALIARIKSECSEIISVYQNNEQVLWREAAGQTYMYPDPSLIENQ